MLLLYIVVAILFKKCSISIPPHVKVLTQKMIIGYKSFLMPSWDITLASCCGGCEVDLSHSQSRLRLRSPRTLSIFWWFPALPNTFPRLPLPVWLIPEGRILESYTAGPITESIISVSCCLQYTVHIHSTRTVKISLIKMAIFCSLIRERKKATLKPSKSNWLVVHSIFLFLLERLLRFASFTKYDKSAYCCIQYNFNFPSSKQRLERN